MSNSRKIKIFADAANLGPAKNIETNDLLNFRRGDSLEIQAAFLENGKIRDMSGAVSATLEILDIGGFNAVNPRSVSLLMRAEASEFSEIDSGASDLQSLENLHAAFNFTQRQTSVAAGEKWLRLFADFADGSRITFASGWIVVSENYSSEPNLLPVENPVYYTKADADETFLAAAQNLGDLPSAASARANLGVFSKAETQALVNAAAAGSHTHSDYAKKSANLSDMEDAEAALQNLGGVSAGEFSAHKNSADLNFASLETGLAAAEHSLSRLDFGKKNVPCARLCGGVLRTNSIEWRGGCHSFCLNLKLKGAPQEYVSVARAGGFPDLNFMAVEAGSSGIRLSVKSPSGAYSEIFEYSGIGFVFGEFNPLVCVFDCNSKIIKLFARSSARSMPQISSGQWGDWADFSAKCEIGDPLGEMSVANIKIFNADLSDARSGYSVPDFMSGEREGSFLLKGPLASSDPDFGEGTDGGWGRVAAGAQPQNISKGEWACQIGSAESYNVSNLYYIGGADLASDTEAAELGIERAVDFASNVDGANSNGVSRALVNTALNLKKFAGEKIRARLSFYYKRIWERSCILGLYSPGDSSNITLFRVSNAPYNTWQCFDEIIEVDVPTSPLEKQEIAFFASSKAVVGGVLTRPPAGSFRVAKFNFKVLCAAASFAERGCSNELRDISSSQNDIFASGRAEFFPLENPAYCRETLSWAGTMASQEGLVEIPENSAVKIYARASSAVDIYVGANSDSQTAHLSANKPALAAELISQQACRASFAPSAVFAGKIDIFYKIERL